MKNRHIVIDAAQIEFHEGGNTLWVHSPNGATVLRIKLLKGQFLVNDKCENIVSHADMQIPEGDVVICLKEKEVR